MFNKADLLPDPEAFLAQVRERYAHAVLTTAREAGEGRREGVRAAAAPDSRLPSPDGVTAPVSRLRPPDGVEGLRGALRTSARALRPVARIRVPLGEGRLLAELHRRGEVLGQEQKDGVLVVTARVEARLLGQLRRDGVAVDIVP